MTLLEQSRLCELRTEKYIAPLDRLQQWMRQFLMLISLQEHFIAEAGSILQDSFTTHVGTMF